MTVTSRECSIYSVLSFALLIEIILVKVGGTFATFVREMKE